MNLTLRRSAAAAMACALTALALPTFAGAQTAPDQPLPHETIQGTILAWTSDEMLSLSDDRGYTDAVAVGEQTAISPNRSALVPGARVTIHGYNGGHWFDALRIDVGATGTAPAATGSYAPAPPPAPVYAPYPYPYGYVYAYPYYGYPYAYGYYPYGWSYGPAVSIGIGFRFGGGWGRGGWGHGRR
jgi:hypothetical protein